MRDTTARHGLDPADLTPTRVSLEELLRSVATRVAVSTSSGAPADVRLAVAGLLTRTAADLAKLLGPADKRFTVTVAGRPTETDPGVWGPGL